MTRTNAIIMKINAWTEPTGEILSIKISKENAYALVLHPGSTIEILYCFTIGDRIELSREKQIQLTAQPELDESIVKVAKTVFEAMLIRFN
ncbi:hypothetical protein [Bacillus sp. AFS088145]|uniref:hypothetical protein n=1 Tax=Bacillus sp. AFS088145 TaxID=2033514 RepID=UPI000BF3E95B|nr:hypothetical protein [Bacillus sp. AFS088145]PFH87651.1 hypothetical protein COI44_08520 [Bacillus sp. AFS088145]